MLIILLAVAVLLQTVSKVIKIDATVKPNQQRDFEKQVWLLTHFSDLLRISYNFTTRGVSNNFLSSQNAKRAQVLKLHAIVGHKFSHLATKLTTVKDFKRPLYRIPCKIEI